MSKKFKDEKITYDKPELKLRPQKKKIQRENTYQKREKVIVLSEEELVKIERQLSEAIAKQQEQEKQNQETKPT